MSNLKKRVLFLYVHNSDRSQMAESFLNKLGADKYFAESAGIEAGTLNQVVVKVMKEIGYDLSTNRTKTVFEIHKTGKEFDYIITLCDPEAAEKCPIFPGKITQLHWGFNDPSAIIGSESEIIIKTREIRDQIKKKIEEFILNGG